MNCDYNHLYIPTNVHRLYKITVYVYVNCPTCFSIKSFPQKDVNTKEYKSNMSNSHSQC